MRLTNLTKVFPGTVALSGVDMEILPGEIHGLVGGNGSGKSTLIKILAGVHQGEPGGTVEVGGQAFAADHASPELAHRCGIRVVHQDLGVFLDMTLAENLSLGHGFDTGPAGRIRWRRIRARTAELIDRFEIQATPRTLLRDMSRAGQTQVAIARALQDLDDGAGGLLILDEPTTALPEHEVSLLLGSLKRYAAAGQSILYVSHRIGEMLDLTDRVTVLRDSRLQGTYPTAELDEDGLIRAIVGRELEAADRPAPPPRAATSVLSVDRLHAGPLRDVSIRVDPGEILGVAGLLGSGRSELLRAIFGDLPVESGTIELDGDRRRWRHPADAIAAGVALVPENRAEEAAFLDQSVYANIGIGSLGRYWRGLRLRDRRMRADGAGLMAEFGVKGASERALISTLSGGNQQKVILARWMRREPRLLLLDEPTQGVDIGARAEIYALVRQAVSRGMAVIVVASDFDELALVSDRAVVLREGRVIADVPRDELTAEVLTQLTHSEGRR
ncbi:sugar ABC transporter ATP-binding protein [Patulibacter sp. NPDC049589]|uniref:sugar ABC transporter ATP-binding protein n=1 Tax=Patulibacter sp. NPDC049589 TaxID=3154731 RepID=UPI00342FD151